MHNLRAVQLALTVLVALCAILQHRILCVELPTIYSAPLSEALSSLLPPLTILIVAILQRFLPPFYFAPLLIYPWLSVGLKLFPQLICLGLLTSLVICSTRADFLCACLVYPIFFMFEVLFPDRTTSLLLVKTLRAYLPNITFSLASTHFATRSKTITKSLTSRGKSPIPSLILTFGVSMSLCILLPLTVPPSLPRPYTLLAQSRGPTGLISVVEKRGEFRMLLSDLSVLGGYFDAAKYYPDSIFSQFHVHEAVRLAGTRDREGTALCIGVGVGVVANAFKQHGVIVTAVEIDPVVALYAKQYFGLDVKVDVEDALSFVANSADNTFDYVVHDVFTGGTMSSALLSDATFKDIARVMKPDGVLAVNFVGDVQNPRSIPTQAVTIIYNRLKSIFGNVRLFSDGLDSRMHNIVFFASPAQSRMSFRPPSQADFLDSPTREKSLMTFQRHEVNNMSIPTESYSPSTSDWIMYKGSFIIAEDHRRLMYSIYSKQLWLALLAIDRAL